MLALHHHRLAIMFAFLMGFASIRAEDIPEGVMPKRQVQGTGVPSSTVPDSTTESTTVAQPTTSDSPDPTTTPTATQDDDPTTTQEDNEPTATEDDDTTTTRTQADDSTTRDSPTTTTGPDSITVTRTNSDGTQETSNIRTDSVIRTTSRKDDDNSVVQVGSKTVDPSTLSKKTTVRAPLVTRSTESTITTSYSTGDNGVVRSSVYTTEIVNARTTGFATATIAPALAHQGGDGDNLSSNAKKIIGGVVGGIGGAILIGGLAFVAWRLWGKKKQQQEANDDIFGSQTDSMRHQKRTSTMTYNTDSAYTNPNGAVNTASNF